MSIESVAHVQVGLDMRDPRRHGRRSYQTSNRAFVIAPHVRLSGILQVDGDVVLESRMAADIRCRTLLVAPTAQIDGVLVAEHVDIYGFVQGEVYANRIVVRDKSRVEAELNYRSLVLEPGGLFEGRSRRHDHPMGLSPRFE